jgi:hypothetical protein
MTEGLGMFWLEDEGRSYDFSEDNKARERAYQAEERRKERIMEEYWEEVRERRRAREYE